MVTGWFEMSPITVQEAWQILQQVKDPEIPVVSLIEMGMIKDVQINGDAVEVTITPTFVGCPALQVMQEEVRARLEEAGAGEVRVNTSHSPPWSSDWITPEGREKLKEFGLAPPPCHSGRPDLLQIELATCPYCGSENTILKNSFGSTACRMIFFCNGCQQPFEQFKPI
jgi:ring-1,2-phenylacetyl-CoA epoxidase subunit PaaD